MGGNQTRNPGGSGGDCFDALAATLLEPSALPALANPESLDAIRDLASELREHSDSVALRVRDALDHAAREWRVQRCHSLEEKERQLRSSGRSDDADMARHPENEPRSHPVPSRRIFRCNRRNSQSLSMQELSGREPARCCRSRRQLGLTFRPRRPSRASSSNSQPNSLNLHKSYPWKTKHRKPRHSTNP